MIDCKVIVLALLASAAGHLAWAQTTLRLTSLPGTTPAGSVIYVAGSFNNWQPAAPAYALARQPDGSYQLTLPNEVVGPQEFKFTRGSWDTGEATAKFQPVANRQATLAAGPATLTFQVAAWQDQGPGAVPAGPRPHTLAANVRVLADSFRLPQLPGRVRRVWLYLPPGYAQARRQRYPVLYLQDGQNVFDDATAYSGEWGVDETLNQLRASGQDPTGCLVVAVDNGGDRRLDEYAPWVNAEYKKGGEGDQYTNFLALTLKPYIDAHYRTRPDAAHTAVAGSSMGGLLALYAGLKYPQVFGRVGVFSPAIWFAKDSILSYERRRPAPRASRFYFVAGPTESETMLPLMVEARNGLLANGVLAANIRLVAPADGKHAEWFWRREFAPAYRWLLVK
ncbi:alpha/beta hydrolase-fold protein [Hymenobacter arcticus]